MQNADNYSGMFLTMLDNRLDSGDEDAMWNWHSAGEVAEHWLNLLILKTLRGE